jgi:hypothetical protein
VRRRVGDDFQFLSTVPLSTQTRTSPRLETATESSTDAEFQISRIVGIHVCNHRNKADGGDDVVAAVVFTKKRAPFYSPLSSNIVVGVEQRHALHVPTLILYEKFVAVLKSVTGGTSNHFFQMRARQPNFVPPPRKEKESPTPERTLTGIKNGIITPKTTRGDTTQSCRVMILV